MYHPRWISLLCAHASSLDLIVIVTQTTKYLLFPCCRSSICQDMSTIFFVEDRYISMLHHSASIHNAQILIGFSGDYDMLVCPQLKEQRRNLRANNIVAEHRPKHQQISILHELRNSPVNVLYSQSLVLHPQLSLTIRVTPHALKRKGDEIH